MDLVAKSFFALPASWTSLSLVRCMQLFPEAAPHVFEHGIVACEDAGDDMFPLSGAFKVPVHRLRIPSRCRRKLRAAP